MLSYMHKKGKPTHSPLAFYHSIISKGVKKNKRWVNYEFYDQGKADHDIPVKKDIQNISLFICNTNNQ